MTERVRELASEIKKFKQADLIALLGIICSQLTILMKSTHDENLPIKKTPLSDRIRNSSNYVRLPVNDKGHIVVSKDSPEDLKDWVVNG